MITTPSDNNSPRPVPRPPPALGLNLVSARANHGSCRAPAHGPHCSVILAQMWSTRPPAPAPSPRLRSVSRRREMASDNARTAVARALVLPPTAAVDPEKLAKARSMDRPNPFNGPRAIIVRGKGPILVAVPVSRPRCGRSVQAPNAVRRCRTSPRSST